MSRNLIIITASSRGYFRSFMWSSSSQYPQHCTVLQQQQFSRIWVPANVCCPPWKWYWLLELRSQFWLIWYSAPHIPEWRAGEADRLRLRLPDGPVRLWTDSTPYSHLCCELSSYSCPKLYLVCWLGLVCTETGISLILVPMDSSPTGFWSPPALGIQHCIAREIHPGPSQWWHLAEASGVPCQRPWMEWQLESGSLLFQTVVVWASDG